MREQKNDSDEHDWNDSPLTKPSLAEYEKAIAKAISELTGNDLRVNVARFDRTPEWAGSHGVLMSYAEMTIRISPPPWRPAADDEK